jgi:hypothetical protein
MRQLWKQKSVQWPENYHRLIAFSRNQRSLQKWTRTWCVVVMLTNEVGARRLEQLF